MWPRGRVGDDVSDDRRYFELGWETVTTHFDAKRGKVDGWIDPTKDVIVTCAGREFLYQSEFDNVLSYEQFRALASREKAFVKDLTRPYWGGEIPRSYYVDEMSGEGARCKFLQDHRTLALSIHRPAIEHLVQDQRYCCVTIRRRSHDAYRNMSFERGKFILERLSDRWPRIFVVGHDLDDLLLNNSISPVNLSTYVSLMSDPRCDLVIGTMTGTMQLAALYSRAAACVVILNYDACDIEKENHPVHMGRCIRISPSRFVFVPPSYFEEIFSTWWSGLRQSTIP
jgi:hypothetical protein